MERIEIPSSPDGEKRSVGKEEAGQPRDLIVRIDLGLRVLLLTGSPYPSDHPSQPGINHPR